MKYIIFAVLSLLSFITSYAQDSIKQGKTTIEQIQSKVGVILKKESQLVEIFKGAEFEILKIYNADNDIISKGVRITTGSSLYSTSPKVAFLDMDELDGVISFYKTIQAANDHVEMYTEYSLSTKGDLKAFAYNDKDKEWTYGLDLDRFYTGGNVVFKKKDIEYVVKILQTAKDHL